MSSHVGMASFEITHVRGAVSEENQTRKGGEQQVIALAEVKRSWEQGAFDHVRKIRTPRYDNL